MKIKCQSFCRLLMTVIITALPISQGAALAAELPLTSQAAQAQIRRAESYMNARQSFSARFVQTTEEGMSTEGLLLVKRPGKMRLTYDPPQRDMIIADGSFVYLWDGTLQQATTLPLGGSLADLILRANVRLSGDVQVTQVKSETSLLEITVQQKNDPDQGRMVLRFEDNPLLFRGWRVIDAQNRTTSVTLQNIQDNVALAEAQFRFISPTLGKSGKNDRPLNK